MEKHLKEVGAEGQSNIICSLWIFFFDNWKTYLRSCKSLHITVIPVIELSNSVQWT